MDAVTLFVYRPRRWFENILYSGLVVTGLMAGIMFFSLAGFVALDNPVYLAAMSALLVLAATSLALAVRYTIDRNRTLAARLVKLPKEDLLALLESSDLGDVDYQLIRQALDKNFPGWEKPTPTPEQAYSQNIPPQAIDMLWEGLARIGGSRATIVDRSSPMTRGELIDRFPEYVARVWSFRNPRPATRADLVEYINTHGAELAPRLDWLLEMYQSRQALLDDPQELVWHRVDPTDVLTWPSAKQKVYYHFDVVGTHPGVFSAPLTQQEIEEDARENGTPVVHPIEIGGFSSALGFLDMFDVSHWTPRPLSRSTTPP